MKITNEGKLGFGSLIGGLGGDPDVPEGETSHDCCDPTPPPDRAEGGPAFVPSTPTSDFPIVQEGTVGGSPSIRVLPVPGTVGNTLIGVVFDRDYNGVEMPPLGGWTEIATGVDALNFNRAATVLYHVVEADESPYTAGGDGVTYPLTPSSGQRTLMIELAGTYDSIFNDADSVPSTTTMDAGGPVTPGAGDDVFVFGAAVMYSNVGSVTEYVDVLALRDEWGGFSPYAWAGYQIVTNASGAYTLGGTMASASHYAGVTAVFAIAGPSVPAWDVPAPKTVDDDDATYQEVEGPDVLRVDLGAAFRIVRARLLIGSEDPGTVTYRIRAGNAADFSDAVEVVVKTFDVTGSFTADDVEFLWSTAEEYRYFELSGTDETRRIYSFELYEPWGFLGEDHGHDGLQEQIDEINEQLDNLDAPVGFVTKALGGQETVFDHGDTGATETVDPADGNVHLLRLDDDCTITLTAPGHSDACAILVRLQQDGTGGWTVTWPGSVEWPDGVAPTLSTDPDAVDFVSLITTDDGTIWFGLAAGGGGGTPATTVESETTFGISPAVGTDTEYARQDHTHGSPDTDAVRDAGRWELAVITGSPPDPLDDGSDFLYIWVS